MSLSMKEEKKCYICKNKSEQYVLLSTNTFCGTADLDTRPAEMKRSTMMHWIQECPHCGYISENLEDESSVTRQWLQSEFYISCGGYDFMSPLAKQFYKYYLINIADENEADAFYAAICAAWACDDKEDSENARNCRLRALEEVEKIISKGNPREDYYLMKADLLRRTGQFERVIQEYKGKSFSQELLNNIVAFQITKAAEKDMKCYKIGDVLNQTKE